VFRATLDLEGAPIRGAQEAPVTIVEFSDFHCPFCRSVQPTLTELLKRYEGKVRLVYKHLPLDSLHPQARRASQASWCAGTQGKFWEFHDAVYASGTSDAGDPAMAAVASQIGLDAGAFATCLAGPQSAQVVDRDVQQGSALGLTGTPGFFINGRELTGAQPLEAFVKVIDEELAARP
jgi:protein-disulfide isomerase